MNDLSSTTSTPLRRGELLALQGGQGMTLAVFAGRLWITHEGEPRDMFAAAGDHVALDRPGLTLVQALDDAQVLPLPPASGAPAWADEHAVQRLARRQRAIAVAALLQRLAAGFRRAWARA